MLGVLSLILLSYVCIRYGILPLLEKLIELIYPDDQDIARSRYVSIMDRTKIAEDYLLVILNKSRTRFGMHKF